MNSLGLRVFPEAHAGRVPAAGEVSPGEIYLRRTPPRWQEAWRITRGLTLVLRREVERRGSRFAVVVVNGKEEVTSARPPVWVDFDKPNRLITEFLARRAIPAVPLLDAFRRHLEATGDTGYFHWDVHWTTVGHEVAAAEIARAKTILGTVNPTRLDVHTGAQTAAPAAAAVG